MISIFCEFGERRALVQIARQPGEFGFLVGQGTLCVVHRAGLDQKLFFGCAKLFAQIFVPRLESKNGRGLFSEFDLEAIDGVALLAKLGKLACASGLELLDAHFQSPRRHGELGAQLILVGLNLGHRQWRGRLEPTHCQTYGPRMDERNDNKPDQSRGKKANAEKHDRLNHGPYVSNSRAFGEIRESAPPDPTAPDAILNPASRRATKKCRRPRRKCQLTSRRSERIPGRPRGELEVADIGPQPQTDA